MLDISRLLLGAVALRFACLSLVGGVTIFRVSGLLLFLLSFVLLKLLFSTVYYVFNNNNNKRPLTPNSMPPAGD